MCIIRINIMTNDIHKNTISVRNGKIKHQQKKKKELYTQS